MNRQFVNYAFTTALYTEKHNFLETFLPFVLKALYVNEGIHSEKSLLVYLKENYDLDIPLNTLKSILTGLSKDGFVNLDAQAKSNWSVFINENGRKEYERFAVDESEVARRQNKLIISVQKFFFEKGIDFTKEEVQNLTLGFVQKNLTKLSIFNLESSVEEDLSGDLLEDHEITIAKFISKIQESDPELYSAYEELIKGSIIREHIANKEDGEDILKFEPLQIYLDANFIFSLLEFHNPAINDSAKQLFHLLIKDPQIHVMAFSMTLEEMARLLRSYKYQIENYNPRIPVNSIFYYLKVKGYDELKVETLINDLDKTVSRLGIAIENQKIRSFEKLPSDEKELYKDVYSYKNQQNLKKVAELQKDDEAIHFASLHDTNIILNIRKKRGSWVKTLERSKAVFLTSSFLMDAFCKKRMKSDGHFPEVILDLTLTNILWLRNPNKEIGIHLHKLISAHSRRFIIDNGIWNRFVNTLKSLKGGGEISREQFATVFSSNQLTIEFLQNSGIEQISEKSILDLAAKIEADIFQKEKAIQEVTKSLEETREENQRRLDSLLIAEKEKNALKEKQDELQKENQKKLDSLKLVEKEKNELKEKQEKLEKELTEIKFQKEKDIYVNGKMEEEFYPLSKKFWSIAIAVVVALFFFFLAEIADQSDFDQFKIPVWFRKWIKFVGFVYPLIVGAINFNDLKDAWQYKFDHRSLKKKYEKTFSDEFNLKNPSNF
jgi:hypothetical protein